MHKIFETSTLSYNITHVKLIFTAYHDFDKAQINAEKRLQREIEDIKTSHMPKK